MTDVLLPLTKMVQSLLDEGKVDEAVAMHNRVLKERMAAARRGETINLSDLMASHEELHLRV